MSEKLVKKRVKCKLFRLTVVKIHDELEDYSKIMDMFKYFANLIPVSRNSTPQLPRAMKFSRIPQSSTLGATQCADSFVRNTSFSKEAKFKDVCKVENIRERVLEIFPKDDGVVFRLEDEFTEGLIASVVRECRQMVSENSMTSENWSAIREFLSVEISDFSELKKELVKAERKCATVKQRAREMSEQNSTGEGFKNSLMACAMLLAEAEMCRDNLASRTAAIIEGFCALILRDFSNSSSYTSLELRLRSVFGSL